MPKILSVTTSKVWSAEKYNYNTQKCTNTRQCDAYMSNITI